MLLVRDESNLASNKMLVGVRPCLRGLQMAPSSDLLFSDVPCRAGVGILRTDAWREVLLKGRGCFSQEHPAEVYQVSFF